MRTNICHAQRIAHNYNSDSIRVTTRKGMSFKRHNSGDNMTLNQANARSLNCS
jgi:hypothetical protein